MGFFCGYESGVDSGNRAVSGRFSFSRYFRMKRWGNHEEAACYFSIAFITGFITTASALKTSPLLRSAVLP